MASTQRPVSAQRFARAAKTAHPLDGIGMTSAGHPLAGLAGTARAA